MSIVAGTSGTMPGHGSDVRRLLASRALRGFADGLVSVLLASYLGAVGLDAFHIGAVVTATLLGSAVLTLGVGLLGQGIGRRRLLLAACALMAATGIGFASLDGFWPLLALAVVGTLNPSAGDVSVFLPTEQAMLASAVSPSGRTTAFAWYNLAGGFAGALGALVSGVPVVVARHAGWAPASAGRAGFVLYALVALAVARVCSGFSPAVEVGSGSAPAAPLRRSRRVVLELAALFSMDSFGGGFVVQSLLVLWLYRRFNLSVETAGAVFFAAGLLGALSQLASARLAARIGLVETMVYTHLPSNLLLVLVALAPSAGWAIALLLARTSISQMDVPARQAYVMALVPPEERAAAASVTNVPRSLAAAAAPLVAGALLARSSFGWPLVCAGLLKAVYDVILYLRFRSLRPTELA